MRNSTASSDLEEGADGRLLARVGINSDDDDDEDGDENDDDDDPTKPHSVVTSV